ncbi:carboxymuconolactone decarboxylase family protein [Aquabacter sp. CN5-332]|uniref:carboxymuconolactone decarboxylase family protein n=1 Tax=Aquabacter sp. CN5-332 TaxID=3156608 RepID=UPI0032B61D92
MSKSSHALAAAPAGTGSPGREAVYKTLFGHVPEKVQKRWLVQEHLGRAATIDAVEHVRRVAIADNPLGLKTQQLVQFGQLAVLSHADSALLHARAALRAGASLEDLAGVAETALITAGVPGYSLGLRIIETLIEEQTSR